MTVSHIHTVPQTQRYPSLKEDSFCHLLCKREICPEAVMAEMHHFSAEIAVHFI